MFCYKEFPSNVLSTPFIEENGNSWKVSLTKKTCAILDAAAFAWLATVNGVLFPLISILKAV